jgi:RHS repeat-associated protein
MGDKKSLGSTVLLIGATLLSVGESALGVGIFLWGSNLSHPNAQGILLCIAPILSLPFFGIVFRSRGVHRWLMWVLACASIVGAYVAMLWFNSGIRSLPQSITSVGLNPVRMPLVILSIVIAALVEFSYRLKQQRSMWLFDCHFTGKERDTESGNDYFGARYFGSSMGRFMSPDWSGNLETVPFADFGNPQSLNLYSYVQNNPMSQTDPDGHDVVLCATGSTQCYRLVTEKRQIVQLTWGLVQALPVERKMIAVMWCTT